MSVTEQIVVFKNAIWRFFYETDGRTGPQPGVAEGIGGNMDGAANMRRRGNQRVLYFYMRLNQDRRIPYRKAGLH